MKKVLSLLFSAIVLLSCFALSTVSASAAEKPVPGYYVVGTMNGWTISKSYLMESANFDNHYVLYQTALKAGDELKIVYSEDGSKASTWYPAGVDNNYVVTESNEYYNIEVAPDYDGAGDGWYEGCIKAQPCPPPIGEPEPTEPRNHTKELWEKGAALTAEDIEEAANEQYQSREYFYADKITIHNSYRFNCTPAYIVDFNVEGYGVYLTVIAEEKLGDYLFYSTSSYEPSIFVDDKLYTLTKAYKAGVLTDEMLAELVETDYMGGDPWNHCRIITRNIKGDADGNGECDIIDATVIQRYNASIISAYDFYKPLGDVDGDSDVTVIDATLIQRSEAGMYTIA
ncbi:MAG: dockerin type I repeat-containing protein [Ruminococcus sp.]|uniref:dockerin type I repeat-containing protein n=1 Tax=Ruminococcus sp. TaxID=41978 RepID=UPI002872D5F2|nr:dockerin type I repeat-containing protein [Ruminococcus sp.]MBQ3284922.1 dockerin type I repeat-containing protein [Ruminococcus sp.]